MHRVRKNIVNIFLTFRFFGSSRIPSGYLREVREIMSKNRHFTTIPGRNLEFDSTLFNCYQSPEKEFWER
jgi:hypothetical protein